MYVNLISFRGKSQSSKIFAANVSRAESNSVEPACPYIHTLTHTNIHIREYAATLAQAATHAHPHTDSERVRPM